MEAPTGEGFYATISGINADGTPYTLANTLYLPYGRMTTQSYVAESGKQVTNVKISKVGKDPANTPLEVYFNFKISCSGSFSSCSPKSGGSPVTNVYVKVVSNVH